MIHTDAHVKQPHMNAHNAFAIAAEVVCIKNELEIQVIPSVLIGRIRRSIQPLVVSGSGHTGKVAQLLYAEPVVWR